MADYDLLDDYYFPLSDEDFENRYLKLHTHTLPIHQSILERLMVQY